MNTELFLDEPMANQQIMPIDSPHTAEPTPMLLIQRAIESGIDPSKLMDLAERWEKNRAAESFGRAIAEFQSRMPVVYKSRTAAGKGNFGGYQYASFDDVMREASPILKDCGIALSFSSEQVNNQLKVTCRVRHGIHAEDHTLTVPVPSMNVNETQKYGAALSYAKRYALCAALNIVVSDEDTDAEGVLETITQEQVATLEEWIETSGADRKRFLKAFAIERLPDMPAQQFLVALGELKRKAGQRK